MSKFLANAPRIKHFLTGASGSGQGSAGTTNAWSTAADAKTSRAHRRVALRGRTHIYSVCRCSILRCRDAQISPIPWSNRFVSALVSLIRSGKVRAESIAASPLLEML